MRHFIKKAHELLTDHAILMVITALAWAVAYKSTLDWSVFWLGVILLPILLCLLIGMYYITIQVLLDRGLIAEIDRAKSIKELSREKLYDKNTLTTIYSVMDTMDMILEKFSKSVWVYTQYRLVKEYTDSVDEFERLVGFGVEK